jgi:WD40 repeat protein
MKKYIVIMALVSGFAPWSMQAMNQMQIFAGQNQAAQVEQQADLTVRTSDDQDIIIPGNRIHYFETLQAVLKDADAADNSAIPLPPVSRATMQQLLADLQLIVNQLHAANTEDQAIAHVTVQSKITELSEQDFINARNAAQFLQSDLLVQLYDAKAIVPILISDASMQSLYNNNAEHMQRIRSINPIFKNEIYQYIKVDDAWFETNTLTRHTRGIRSAAFSPDGIKIVTISDDNTTKIWDVLTGKCLHALDGRHTALVRSAIFSPDRTKIVTGFENGTAKIWDVLTGQCHTLAGHTGGIDSAAFSPDGKKIVTASYDNTVRIWDALTGEFLHALEGHTERVDSVVFSPDGKKIVTASADRTAKIWNVLTGLFVSLSDHTDSVLSASFSSDGTKIVTASADRTAKIWNALTGECLHTLEGHAERVCSAAFSPDGTKIVTASWDNTAKIWDASTGEYLHTLESHSNWVFSAAFSPDGNAIVTASDDYTAKIWQLFPAHNFDQALFARLLAWAKRKGHAAVWQTEWARSVMNTYSAEDQALIKKWYPPQTQTIMQRISGYLNLLDNA